MKNGSEEIHSRKPAFGVAEKTRTKSGISLNFFHAHAVVNLFFCGFITHWGITEPKMLLVLPLCALAGYFALDRANQGSVS